MTSRWLDTAIRRLHLERFFYGEGPEPAPITLDRHRIFILPSREGLVFGSALGAMLIGSINYTNSMAFLLTFLLAGLSLVSMLHTYRNLSLLTFRAGSCSPVFSGEAARYTIWIDNPTPMQRFALTLVLDGGAPTHVDVPAQTATRVVLTRPTTQRGYALMGRCTVSTRFPVGLFRAWAYIDLGMQCLVYPMAAPAQSLPPLHPSDQARGETRGLGAEDFVGLRQYVPGDASRHVAWKRAAQDDQLLTKQFAGDGAMQRWLTWDSLGHAETENRLSVLCRWVLDAHAETLPYGLRLPEHNLDPAHTPAHRDACLKALALFGAE